jgi:methionyl-tRNA synthetase
MIDMEAAKSTPAPEKSVPSAPSVVESFGEPQDSNHPAAAPRAATVPNPGATVAGSHALTTEREPTPPSEAAREATSQIAPQIAIDDFVKVDLRVAQILVAERIPKADKLLRLEVDLGYEKRQILSGIAEWYTPEELIGRRIVIVANLAPRKMRGLESHGMLLAASSGDHTKPILATFPGTEDPALGSRVR